MTKICKNCGYGERKHNKKEFPYFFRKVCKKFEEEVPKRPPVNKAFKEGYDMGYCHAKTEKPKNHSPLPYMKNGDGSENKVISKDTPSDKTRNNTGKEGTFNNLSEKIEEYGTPSGGKVIYVKDIKTFIQKRNRLDMMMRNREITWEEYIEERNKLAGDELK